ncbi:hypothetical protein SLEP1_g46863 [Rubroshorea leprosula]|uniref:F-box associated beta-propeller type 1 domain-containing protein n=1 Tax=Rubroshorea leprosula TaxID=152421 RepID=A0AAV5LRA9_9ROSI|nr:hypothetical protein SLEP1_g46863 [Rubroshorea leprosula]
MIWSSGIHQQENVKGYQIYVLRMSVKVSIFSLKENSWRIFGGEVDDFRAGVKRATFLNGALHWRFASHIYGFDLAKETFFKIQFPASCVPPFDKGLGVLNGCLCFLKAPDYDPEIGVMEEYGNPESWTKLLLCDFDCRDILRLCYFPGGLYNYHEHFPVSHALLCISKDDDGRFVLIDDARENITRKDCHL